MHTILNRTKATLILLIVSFSLGFQACNGSSDSDSLDDEIAMDLRIVAAKDVPEMPLNNLIQTIPSPIEMASLIKKTGGEFNQNLLNSTDHIHKYNTSLQQAFNIGIYSADLGYINIYEKTFSAMEYIGAIKSLSDEIKVGQFFDFETLKNLAASSKNVDSLLYISINSFNKMDEYLRKQKRGELSVLIVSGAWLEGLHIACQVAKTNPNEQMNERIGEQKIVLNNILLTLYLYKKNDYFVRLAEDFQKLKTIYDGVTITYMDAEPGTKEVNGQLVIVDNSTSKINMTKQQLNEIISTVNTIRNKLVN